MYMYLLTDNFITNGGNNRSQSELSVFGLHNVAVLQHRCSKYFNF